MKRLRALSVKHGPSLCNGGYAAMNIFEHPERAMDSVFAVAMRPRRDSTRSETGFYAYDAQVFRIADLPYSEGRRDSIKEMIVAAGARGAQRKFGAAGVFMVMIHNAEGCMTSAVPFTYFHLSENPHSTDRQENWKAHMLWMLNEGIVQY
ncbi:hypothetical protein LXA43DRAFT_895657 [Ganoderma leucocontextum]|nr:hypothetical protein LXA43DRAFT_895657 [Ganoderma leucocontextum]